MLNIVEAEAEREEDEEYKGLQEMLPVEILSKILSMCSEYKPCTMLVSRHFYNVAGTPHDTKVLCCNDLVKRGHISILKKFDILKRKPNKYMATAAKHGHIDIVKMCKECGAKRFD